MDDFLDNLTKCIIMGCIMPIVGFAYVVMLPFAAVGWLLMWLAPGLKDMAEDMISNQPHGCLPPFPPPPSPPPPPLPKK